MARIFCIALTVAFLAACNGSQGGSSSAGTGYPVNDAISAFLQSNNSYTLHGSSDGNAYTLTLSWQYLGQHSFQGASAYATKVTEQIDKNGSLFLNDGGTKYFLLGPYNPLGEVTVGGGTVVDTNQTALPAMAQISQTGNLDSETLYGGIILSKAANTWSLGYAGTTGEAKFCIKSTRTYGEAMLILPPPTTTCYVIDSRGNVLDLQMTIPVFQNKTFQEVSFN